MTRRFCLTLDLKNDHALMSEYRKYHETIWPEITQSIHDAGIEDMQIYLRGMRVTINWQFTRKKARQKFGYDRKNITPSET